MPKRWSADWENAEKRAARGLTTRAGARRLLIPYALAVAVVATAGTVSRNWVAEERVVAPVTAVTPATPYAEEALPDPQIPTPADTGSQEPQSPVAEVQRETGGGQAAHIERRDQAQMPQSDMRSAALSSIRHSFGPAPEPVIPSHEAALRPSVPPPAVASAPSPTPALVMPAVPAPEPRAAPRLSPARPTEPRRKARPTQQVRAVRFDASYYYGRGLSARDLAQELAQSWADQGINLVYYYAYNRVYGARYRTRYAGNIMEDYGQQDLLRHTLRECHRRGIKVVAWLQGVQHKQMWESHPEWRQKTPEGSDYKPDADSYFLCVRNPEVTEWWLGLVDELLQSYPELDGVDLAEFQLDLWGDHSCYCEHCREQFAKAHPRAKAPSDTWRRFRADGLSRVLLATSRLAHGYGKEVHLTTVFTARRDGKLMASTDVRDATGFDLEAVLASADGPDVIQAELIWQQWAATYADRRTFTPQWTESAVRQAKAMVGGRARLIAHLEVTDFGSGGLDGPGLARTIASATLAEPYGIDIYDAHLLAETRDAGRYLQLAWLGNGG